MTTLAIIGTAGRRDDARRLSTAVWNAMVENARDRVLEMGMMLGYPIELVSGGAAFADHLAVRLYLDGDVDSLILHLPADLAEDGYRESGKRQDPARTANGLHRQFRKITGVDSIAEIHQAIAEGANHAVTYGFKARNTKVANTADCVVAYTFGGETPGYFRPSTPGFTDPETAGLKEGGTADTWRKMASVAYKIHVPVHRLTPIPEPGARSRPGPSR